jgi:hypothetical protein
LGDVNDVDADAETGLGGISRNVLVDVAGHDGGDDVAIRNADAVELPSISHRK